MWLNTERSIMWGSNKVVEFVHDHCERHERQALIAGKRQVDIRATLVRSSGARTVDDRLLHFRMTGKDIADTLDYRFIQPKPRGHDASPFNIVRVACSLTNSGKYWLTIAEAT